MGEHPMLFAPTILSRDGKGPAPQGSILDPCAVFLPSHTELDRARGRISKDRRRAKILAAARSMVEERGFDHVQVRALARRAGVTPPTIYSLIGGRQHVLNNAIEEGIEAKRWLAIQKSKVDHILPILAYTEVMSFSASLYPRYYKQVMKDLYSCTHGVVRAKSLTKCVNNMFFTWLEAMQDHGTLRNHLRSNEEIAELLSSQLSNGVIEWIRGDLDAIQLRHEVMLGAALVLLSFIIPHEAKKIEIWLEREPWSETSFGKSRTIVAAQHEVTDNHADTD